ncbi:MAG: Arginine--tRNA ligase [Opitutia bacterium UBA7350]|nr:MAG: Arginine--tRNA ligase [Opitutae bacterium UBA7350]
MLSIMELSFNPAATIDAALRQIISNSDLFNVGFDPEVRPADPRFGDYQANGVLRYAKKNGKNPRELAQAILKAAEESELFDASLVELSLAGPGFINFKCTHAYLGKWLNQFASIDEYQKGAGRLNAGRKIVIDYPSANTAKQAHIGHLRPMVIGEAIARLLDFCGSDTVRDNHIGDWGTNFGTLIMQIKREGVNLDHLNEDPLAQLDQLYKDGSNLEKQEPLLRDQSRAELLKLQEGDPQNTALWEKIVAISKNAFQKLFQQMGVQVDISLGESFYRDRVERVYRELTDAEIAELSEGALVVWHDEVKKFARNNERPYPFNIRKKDGASNYASTDLATILYRVEHFKAEEIVYLTDARQQDHFQQLFLTTQKWFRACDYPLPVMRHVWWGTILGKDKKPFKTKSGESIKLQALLDEARERALAVVAKKNPDLPEKEQQAIASSVGIGALKYADLASNRTQDYVFDWDRMLSFEGNTAPYLLYAVARINSIFRKTGIDPDARMECVGLLETEAELTLARKLMGLSSALDLTLADLRPHFLCTYLFELAGAYSSFYNADKVMVEDPSIRERRLLLCARTRNTLITGLQLLGIEPLERM